MDNLNSQTRINQKVIHDNKEIFETIKRGLQNARQEILIASAWFTDNELFDILIQKLQEGVKVDLIVADNLENTKLNFNEIVEKGGMCLKIKNVGFGMMHTKFCVIDQSVAIHGSYNFSNNAKKNNHESVIITDHIETVNNLIENFNLVKQKAIEKLNGMETTESVKFDDVFNKIDQLNNNQNGGKKSYQIEYEQMLSTLVESEINHFDRKELHDLGFKRAESCNGDFNILPNSLDTVYFHFINDINISKEQKERLLVKLNENKANKAKLLELEKSNFLNRVVSEKEIKERNIKDENEILSAENSTLEKRIEAYNMNDIVGLKEKIEKHKEDINAKKREFIKPKFRLYELIPIGFLNLSLFIYLVLFYSSAAYILVFSKADTILALKNGAEIPPHAAFDPNAINLALAHGGSTIFFIFFFVVIPLSFALADRYVNSKAMRFFISYILGIFLIDGILGYTVAKTIYELQILTGEITAPWSPSMAFSDVNFYLVFIMGAAGLLVFKFAYSKFMSYFEERSADLNAQKNQLVIAEIEEKIAALQIEIAEIKEKVLTLETDIISNKSKIQINMNELSSLPLQMEKEKELYHNEYALKMQYYDHVTSLYINKVENNNPSISVDALRDRINTFLEGWSDFLHGFYSVELATNKSANATEVTSSWLNTKLSLNKNSIANN